MTQNWICVINRENFGRLQKHKVWGVKERYKKLLERAEVGDFLVFYIIGEQVLGGIFTVIKSPFKESKKIFPDNIYPRRLGIKAVLLPKIPVPFSKELRNKVAFIKNKQMWSGSLRKPMKPISNRDFEIISNVLQSKD